MLIDKNGLLSHSFYPFSFTLPFQVISSLAFLLLYSDKHWDLALSSHSFFSLFHSTKIFGEDPLGASIVIINVHSFFTSGHSCPLWFHLPKLLWFSYQSAGCVENDLCLWQILNESSLFSQRKRDLKSVFKTAFKFITEILKTSQLFSIASKNRTEGKVVRSKQ